MEEKDIHFDNLFNR